MTREDSPRDDLGLSEAPSGQETTTTPVTDLRREAEAA